MAAAAVSKSPTNSPEFLLGRGGGCCCCCVGCCGGGCVGPELTVRATLSWAEIHKETTTTFE